MSKVLSRVLWLMLHTCLCWWVKGREVEAGTVSFMVKTLKLKYFRVLVDDSTHDENSNITKEWKNYWEDKEDSQVWLKAKTADLLREQGCQWGSGSVIEKSQEGPPWQWHRLDQDLGHCKNIASHLLHMQNPPEDSCRWASVCWAQGMTGFHSKKCLLFITNVLMMTKLFHNDRPLDIGNLSFVKTNGLNIRNESSSTSRPIFHLLSSLMLFGDRGSNLIFWLSDCNEVKIWLKIQLSKGNLFFS